MRKLNDNQRIAKAVEIMYATFDRLKINATHLPAIIKACDKYVDHMKAKEIERVDNEMEKLKAYKKELLQS